MRVENNNLAEITQTKNKVEMKGNVTVSVEETTACKVEKNTGKVTSVQQTTVDRPFFSGESQLDQISQEAENMELQVMQEKIKAVSNALSEGDCEKLEEDGYTVNGSEVDTIITEMDKIKMELAKAGVFAWRDAPKTIDKDYLEGNW